VSAGVLQARPQRYISPVAAPSPYQLLATSITLGVASVARTSLGCLELCTERLPRLLALAQTATRQETASARATGELRDELIALARSCSEVTLRELTRGVEDMDEFTRPSDEAPASSRRRYKAKP
jgi:hypothetical protein